jgi:hypothetical protein
MLSSVPCYQTHDSGLEPEGHLSYNFLCARNKYIFKKEGDAIFIHVMQSNT